MSDEPAKGIVLIDKPVGWTSFDVVAKIRGKIRAEYTARGEKPTKKQLRVGHAGTLDPFATALLIVLLGDACKRAGEFLKLDKVYEATIRLGQVSTTGDPEGEITESSKQKVVSSKQISETLKGFIGESEQTPPMFSAIKINGQRAYKLARRGEVVEIPKRTVTIYSLELLDYSYPELRIRVHVSSGTYIRSLAIDIGAALGTGAYCSELRRTKIADWSVVDARKLDDVEIARLEK
ncbi:tRNA pseudouridine(55) synthase TruB [Candidatus Saccharibacteria bacterium]|nr:MAG: tRNA pseudouridine(55) synthase TruB [Candidatus Saccharibacteria bacterium]